MIFMFRRSSLSYVGIQMVEKECHVFYPTAFKHVSGRPQGNNWFLVFCVCEFYLFRRIFCIYAWSIHLGGLLCLVIKYICARIKCYFVYASFFLFFLVHIASRI